MHESVASIAQIISGSTGYIYPNEYLLQWGLLIVMYPFLTGLVAGAFILASLERVLGVRELLPVYRLSLISALAFLLVAPLPLLAHLGHPERALEMFLTPNSNSAMAMFGFVYAWYLLVVLLLEIWFDYRKQIVIWSREKTGFMKFVYKILTLGVTDLSPEALRFDDRIGRVITIVGIPSAFLLHGYVGFIFGSIKANPWWSSVLMPVVFLFSAIVSGMAVIMLIYMMTGWFRWKKLDMACLNKLGELLIYVMLVDVALEMLDFIHRLYESEESIHILRDLVANRLFLSLIISQVVIGSLCPLAGMVAARFGRLPDEVRRILYFLSAILILIGIYSVRWNVVIGGQLFSKSLRGLTVYKMNLLGMEGVGMSVAMFALPFIILAVLAKIFPPWIDHEESARETPAASS